MGKREYCPPGWSQPAGQYEGWNGQYPQQGWDGQNPQQGWDGQPGAQIDDVQSTPAAAIGQGDVDNLQNDPNYYFDSNGERGPGLNAPDGPYQPGPR